MKTILLLTLQAWFREVLWSLRGSLSGLAKKFLVESGDLNVGFHHVRLGWTGSIRRLARDSSAAEITLSDPIDSETKHTHVFQERSVWELRNTFGNVRTGALLVNGNAIRDSARSHSSRRTPRFRWPQLSNLGGDQSAIVFNAHQPRNYYHWMLEDLPSILRASAQAPGAEVVLPKNLPPYVFESLRLAGIHHVVATGRHIRGATVILAGQGDDTGWPHPNDIHVIQERVLKRTAGEPTAGRDLYVARPPGRRSFTNHETIARVMQQNGLEVVFPERLSLREQIALFSSARTVVGAHGAALVNLVFCNPGTRVLEIALTARAIQAYECLAHYCRLDYARVLIPAISTDEKAILSEEALKSIGAWFWRSESAGGLGA